MQEREARRLRRVRALLALTATVALAGTLASLAHLAWWLELFCHFRPQYALLLVACGAGLFALRRPGLGVAALALAAANAVPLLHYLGPAPQPPIAGPAVKAVLLNLWFRNGDHQRVLDYLAASDPDLAVFLEVTPAWSEALRSLDGQLPYRAEAGEVYVASRHPFTGLRALPLGEAGAMALVFSVRFGDAPVTVIGAHANWPLGRDVAASRARELDELAAIARHSDAPVIVLGDFNVTAFSPAFTDLLARSALSDCAAGQGFNPTWPALFPPLYMQIDHCLARGGLGVTRLHSGPYVGSDHLPLEVELRLQPPGSSAGTRAARRLERGWLHPASQALRTVVMKPGDRPCSNCPGPRQRPASSPP